MGTSPTSRGRRMAPPSITTASTAVPEGIYSVPVLGGDERLVFADGLPAGGAPGREFAGGQAEFQRASGNSSASGPRREGTGSARRSGRSAGKSRQSARISGRQRSLGRWSAAGAGSRRHETAGGGSRHRRHAASRARYSEGHRRARFRGEPRWQIRVDHSGVWRVYAGACRPRPRTRARPNSVYQQPTKSGAWIPPPTEACMPA